jgi:hypothetical protein
VEHVRSDAQPAVQAELPADVLTPLASTFVPGFELPHAACHEGGPLYEWGDAGERSPLNLHVTDATGDMMEKT